MTLCIAWRENSKVNFLSDSRLTFKENSYVDLCIKVMKVPIKIISPISSETNQFDELYNHNAGICFAGNVISSLMLKELICDVLQDLQFVPFFTNVSMEQIAKSIDKFYRHILVKMCEEKFEDGLATFIISGYCPQTENIRTFKFTPEITTYPINTKYEEILKNDEEIDFLGSGAEKAKELYDNGQKNIFYIIRDIINDDNIKTVGGPIQYGSFDNNNDFRIYGVLEHSKDEKGFLNSKFKFRSIDYFSDETGSKNDDLHIRLNFIDPFNKDIDNLLQESPKK